MKKFLHLTKRQPSLEQSAINRSGWPGAERSNGKSLRRVSTTSLTTKNIHIVRGAYNIDLNKVDNSFNKLHKACLLNDDTRARKYVRKIDCNEQDNSKRSPLHLATVNGNYLLVKLLIENKANVNLQDSDGKTPLIKSIECGHDQLVQYLVRHDANPNIADSDGNTALHWVLMTESIVALNYLINTNKCNGCAKNVHGETCLHLAVKCPMFNSQVYEALIKTGADLHAKNNLGSTPLEIARSSENIAAINSLNKLLDRENACSGKHSPVSSVQIAADTSLLEAHLGEQSSEIMALKPINITPESSSSPESRLSQRAKRSERPKQDPFSSNLIENSKGDKTSTPQTPSQTNAQFLDDLQKLLDPPRVNSVLNELSTNPMKDHQSINNNSVVRNDSDVCPYQPSKKLKKSPSDNYGSLVRKMSLSAEDVSQVKQERRKHFPIRNKDQESFAIEDSDDEPIRASKSFDGFGLTGSDLENHDVNFHLEENITDISRSNIATNLNSYNNRTLIETQKICNEFRKKFNQKNRDNLELEKKVIHLESQSNHLRLDIISIEEHNRILEYELRKVRKLQAVDREELKSLKIEIEKLLNKNNALARERQQLETELENLRVSIKTQQMVDPNIHVATTNESNLTAINFHSAKNKLQEKINELKFELKSEP